MRGTGSAGPWSILVALACVALAPSCASKSDGAASPDDARDEAGHLPDCAARMPREIGHFAYPASALPSGACTTETTCELMVEEACACAASTTSGETSADVYTCTCNDARWGCALLYPAASACGDAGACAALRDGG